MKVAICDDNIEYTNSLEDYFSLIKTLKLECDVYHRGEDLVLAHEKNNACYDAIFLDMEMDTLDGVETANLIRKTDKHVIIVFITNYSKYMQRSFECSPFRFLMKPVTFEAIEKILHEVCIKLSEERTTFVFTEDRNTVRLFSDDILYFESQGHWILIHTKTGTHKIRKTMKDLLMAIDSKLFLQVHRAFVVNMSHIYKIKETEIIMHYCDTSIPLSRTYKKASVNEIINFKERKYLL